MTWASLPRLATLATLATACHGAGGEARRTTAPAAPSLPEQAPSVGPAETAFELAMNEGFLVCVRFEGRVHCGPLRSGRLLVAEPPLAGVSDAVSVAVGGSYTRHHFACAATQSRGVLCFGDNTYGQLGAGSQAESSTAPLRVAGLTGVRRVFAGPRHACALLGDRGVRCWGQNDRGQVGSPDTYTPSMRELVTPFEVGPAKGASWLALSYSASCATMADGGDLVCWGDMPLHQEAAWGPQMRRPQRIAGTKGMSDISASARSFCGVRDGDVLCWGAEPWLAHGALGIYTPHRVGLKQVRRVRLGDSHACALHNDGRVSCWGDNSEGQLGHSEEPQGHQPLEPRVVEGLPPAIDIAAGGPVSCAVTVTYEVYCWGAKSYLPHAEGAHERARLVNVRVLE